MVWLIEKKTNCSEIMTTVHIVMYKFCVMHELFLFITDIYFGNLWSFDLVICKFSKSPLSSFFLLMSSLYFLLDLYSNSFNTCISEYCSI